MSSARTTWVGIDVGTQSVRVAVVDDAGAPLAFGSALLESRRSDPERWHEQDPHQWWESVGAASRQAFAAVPAASGRQRVGGVAICSTSGTVLLTDGRGAPLTEAMMYDDARGVDDLQTIRRLGPDVPGSADVQLSWALPKIGWLLRHHGGSTRSAYIAHSADAIAAAFVGNRVPTDTSHSLKSGYDVVRRQWNQPLVEAVGADLSMLPEVVRPGTMLGTVTATAARHTGIPRGTPVVAGMTDGCAAQIAAGALEPGQWSSVVGTTLVLKGVSRHIIADPGGAVYNHLHPDGGWLPGGASNVGAGVISHEFGKSDLERLTAAAQAHEPAGAVVYPLTARGERFPFVRPDAVRFQIGKVSSAAEQFAALIQGVAFVERLCFERFAALGADVSGEISITGGATKSLYWNQLRSDVLGRPLVVPATPQPSFGMAVLASAQGASLAVRAARMIVRKEVVVPRPGAYERLSVGYRWLTSELVDRGYITKTFTAGTFTENLSRSMP